MEGHEAYSIPQVGIMLLSKNTACVLQPLDQVVGKTLKSKLKWCLTEVKWNACIALEEALLGEARELEVVTLHDKHAENMDGDFWELRHSVRVSHRGSTRNQYALFVAVVLWQPHLYKWYDSSRVHTLADTFFRPQSIRQNMPERLVRPTSVVTVVRWTSGGVRAPAQTRYEWLGG